MEQLVARRAHNPKVISSSLVPATKTGSSTQVEGNLKWPVRLPVRTPDFHSGNRGSIPLRATKPLYESRAAFCVLTLRSVPSQPKIMMLV